MRFNVLNYNTEFWLIELTHSSKSCRDNLTMYARNTYSDMHFRTVSFNAYLLDIK